MHVCDEMHNTGKTITPIEFQKVENISPRKKILISNTLEWISDGGEECDSDASISDPEEPDSENSSDNSELDASGGPMEMEQSAEISVVIYQSEEAIMEEGEANIHQNLGSSCCGVILQVDGVDLAEIEGGEVATTNLHSCNGPEFVLQLRFSINQNSAASRSPGSRASQEANARLKCVYFPIVEGKESIDRILEKLEAEECGLAENFHSFSRVSIRRLGRLLPDARWGRLPFMEPRQRKGDRGQVLKRCCLRVKCFVDFVVIVAETDAGFNPTPSKTDLAHHHPYTTALKNFGNKPLEKEKDINVEIRRAGKPLTLSQLEKEYQDWVFQMHDGYDEEMECGEDQPVLVVSPCNKNGLGISSDVVRVHRVIRRKGTSWKSGQKVKILKGAYIGCHKNNLYATLEYILLEGFQGDVGGEARLICRPLELPDENGCLLTVNAGDASLDIRGSLSLPISVIDTGKFQAVQSTEWDYQLEKRRQKAPSIIDILSAQHCRQLDIDGVSLLQSALPVDSPVFAGHVPPEEIVAVVRPGSFISSSVSKSLDQKYIVKDDLEMLVEVKCIAEGKDLQDKDHIYSGRIRSSSRKGFYGLYVFSLGCKVPGLFQRAGIYTFSFSIMCTDSSYKECEKRVIVKPCSKVGKWQLLSADQTAPYSVMVGSCFPPLSIACYDTYSNRIPFTCIPEVRININVNEGMLVHVDKMKVGLSSDKLTMKIKDVLIKSSELDKIRPHYEATLVICPQDDMFSVTVPCQVAPGLLHYVRARSPELKNHLLPGDVIEELVLEIFDAYGNHVKEGLEILLNVDGFSFQDQIGLMRKVDDQGCVNLSGLLKVMGGYGKNGMHFCSITF
ncbi:hypothetical protein HHK36_029171 [Tetracentron sinense]|uniref:Uncharacterized protein n=1 Tax=Tetracentron sinense TaxID=13715 RepID=A0A834YEK4_TETSI|nr:hypothetical protein HHK36_029171 [Tetracentron sinense]